ncbi:hypothetical protein POM88_000361 [Heracleum sosnowskyi]|uniref:Uncharacterized protein n=1 Tax=Heracleum sosnowskyi TaxID=360622 RepID=A0AAD8N9P0_9APIA|nr:hypothetical protein POM88_000361 [Heracleum sosnowskyi]
MLKLAELLAINDSVSSSLTQIHPELPDQARILMFSPGIENVIKPHFVEMLTNGKLNIKSSTPVTSIIAGRFYNFAVDLAKGARIPLMYIDTISPCALSTFFCHPWLIELGEVPFKEEDYDRNVSDVPGT